jgi:hypothetical protein
MASDQSPTQNRTILTVAGVALVSLIGLKFVFDSYFIEMAEAAAKDKLPVAEQLIKHRSEESKALASGPMPIDQAMAELGRNGRTTAANPGVDVSPRQSNDTGALIGWSKMPRAIPEAPQPAAVVAPHAPAESDAGATGDASHSSDASHLGDAGAHAPGHSQPAPGHDHH